MLKAPELSFVMMALIFMTHFLCLMASEEEGFKKI